VKAVEIGKTSEVLYRVESSQIRSSVDECRSNDCTSREEKEKKNGI